MAGVLTRSGRVLAARRALHKREGGLWEFPGGKVDSGESDADALVRELREELGVTVVVGVTLAESVHTYPHGVVRLVAMSCLSADEPIAREHVELRWLVRDALWSVEWAPADVPLVTAVGRMLEPSSEGEGKE